MFRGAGVSSSAAFEVLVAEIFNSLYLKGRLLPGDKAAIGQFAENVYFGKPCGLLDQSGVAYGGLNEMDFKRPDTPFVAPLPVPKGYVLAITNTGGSHASLTEHYAAIRKEMGEAAAFFGKKALREVDEREFFSAIPALRKKVSERAVLRAFHFFEENERADRAAQALKRGETDTFLRLLKESGESSQKYLQNCFVPGSESQPVALALRFRKRSSKTAAIACTEAGLRALCSPRKRKRAGKLRPGNVPRFRAGKRLLRLRAHGRRYAGRFLTFPKKEEGGGLRRVPRNKKGFFRRIRKCSEKVCIPSEFLQ